MTRPTQNSTAWMHSGASSHEIIIFPCLFTCEFISVCSHGRLCVNHLEVRTIQQEKKIREWKLVLRVRVTAVCVQRLLYEMLLAKAGSYTKAHVLETDALNISKLYGFALEALLKQQKGVWSPGGSIPPPLLGNRRP